MNIRIQHYDSPFGSLILGSYGDRLCLCDWRYRKMRESIDRRICSGFSAEYREEPTEVTREAVNQLREYFERKRTVFDLPVLPVGTDFQKRVWQELMQIPYGQTVTYLDLSRRLGNELAIRAVASANGANAISIIIPCHRIVGSNGELTGYAGGLPAKRRLLELEGGGGSPTLF